MTMMITKMAEERNDTVNRRFKHEKKMLKFKLRQTMAEYVRVHRPLRIRMHQAAFPKMKNNVSTVPFIVNSVVGNPRYLEASRALRLVRLIGSIKLLYKRTMEQESAMEEQAQTKIPTPLHTQ